MKITFLVNDITKTSIPLTWKNAINKRHDMNVKIIGFKNISAMNLKFIGKSDLIHGHHIKLMAIFLMFNLFFSKKTLFTVHCSYSQLSRVNKFFLKFIFKSTDNIVFVNKSLFDELSLALKNLIICKHEIILNGINTNPSFVKTNVYKKYNIPGDNKIIFHPARFVKEKNHMEIIKAYKLFSKKKHDTKLILAGDGILKKKITNLVSKLNLEGNVLFIGTINRDEVYSFLSECELFIMPSISEGLNIAFLEALSIKSKIVVSNIKQFIYPFEHHKIIPEDLNVYFADPAYADKLCDKFIKAFNSEKKYNFDISAFDIETMISKYITLYKNLNETQ